MCYGDPIHCRLFIFRMKTDYNHLASHSVVLEENHIGQFSSQWQTYFNITLGLLMVGSTQLHFGQIYNVCDFDAQTLWDVATFLTSSYYICMILKL